MKLPNFTGTPVCQLCQAEPGTLLHRSRCTRTKPTLGWTPFDQKTSGFLDSLSEDRVITAQTRGVLTVRIPIPEPQIASLGWRWLTEQPDPNAEGLVWVIDGSRRFASEWALATTGCGVAVIDRHGGLVAYATATPPPWVKTASAAEAWALLLTLRMNPSPPRILTDCLGLLIAARAGPFVATHGKRADARIWKMIDAITGDSFKLLAASLVWMPAHTTASEAHKKAKSDGKELSAAEWRANDLADKLAKKGALSSPLREAADKTIKTAGSSLVQVAARLGVVTLAANQHRVEFTKPDGEIGFRFDRDSSPLPAHAAREKLAKKEAAAPAPAPAVAPKPPKPAAAPLVELTAKQTKQEERRRRAATEAASQSDQLACLVTAAASSSVPQPVSAADRLAALRARRGLAAPSLTQSLEPE